MSEYRRGIKDDVWQTRWHFHEQCPDYPTRNFAVAVYKPSDEQICRKCTALPRADIANGISVSNGLGVSLIRVGLLLAKRGAVGAYRLQYLDRSGKFIRQDVVNATTDEGAIALAKNWRLRRRSELWADGRLVAKFSRDTRSWAGR